MVLTEPPPPEPSMMRTIGSRSSCAMRSAWMAFSGIVASAEPPRTVKSSPLTTTGRPSIMARPEMRLAGVKLGQAALVVVGALAGERADLAEGAGIDEAVDALADGKAAAGLLPRHLVGAAHLLGETLADAQLIELGLPALGRGLGLEIAIVRHSPRVPS